MKKVIEKQLNRVVIRKSGVVVWVSKPYATEEELDEAYIKAHKYENLK
jgi:hypothetical protein